jgi:triosephosphate isomerase
VSPANVASLLSRPQLDGVLVGGASLNPESWTEVIDRGSKATVRPSGGFDLIEG